MTQVNRQEWDDYLDSQSEISILQTSAWGELKASFGWEPIRIIVDDIGVQILFRKILPGITFAYIPRAKLPENSITLWNEIDAVCKEKRAFFLRYEPAGWQDEGGVQIVENYQNFQTAKHSIQPRRTILIDLSGTEDDWLARMKQKTRYNIRLAQKKGVLVESSSDVGLFARLMAVTGDRDTFGVHSQAYYQKVFDVFSPGGLCQLLVARFENEPLAAIMVFAYKNRAYYLYGASGNDNRNLMPNYILQWEAMRWASGKNCIEYDLWGIPDEDEEVLEKEFISRTDGLWPVYRFKRGFGGKIVRSPSAKDRIYNALIYRFFQHWINR